MTALGLVAFGGMMMAVPLVVTKISKPMISSDSPLTGSQIQRGVFMNTGSKDAGRDPDWNLQTRTWEGRRNNVEDPRS